VGLAARLGSKIYSQLSKFGYQFLGDIFEHFVTNHLYTLYFWGLSVVIYGGSFAASRIAPISTAAVSTTRRHSILGWRFIFCSVCDHWSQR